MLPNDDLARWGEPPTDDSELALAELLAAALERDRERSTVVGDADPLVQMGHWIEEMIGTLAEQAGVLAALGAVVLRVTVSRLVGGVYQPMASSHPVPCVLRDLRRVPEDTDRVTLQTGERVRVEVACDTTGYLLVFNVGPRGGLNVLYPQRRGETGRVREGETLPIADVEVTLPAGRERVYAVWSRTPVAVERLFERGATVRDLKRVQETFTPLGEGEWHAVLLELDHST